MNIAPVAYRSGPNEFMGASFPIDHRGFAGVDSFENEPNPSIKILMNSNVSLTPHIGAATGEAQDRIGVELAEKINEILN